jgi:hypothetical protein
VSEYPAILLRKRIKSALPPVILSRNVFQTGVRIEASGVVPATFVMKSCGE